MILSRFENDRAISKDGKPIARRLTAKDYERFAVLYRYQYLTIPFIAALSGSSPDYTEERLRELRLEPYRYVAVPDPHKREKNVAAKLPYELADMGLTKLVDRGLPPQSPFANEYSGPFDHRLKSCQVRASFEIGAAENDTVSIVEWPAILNSPKIPEATRKLTSPQFIPVILHQKGDDISRSLRADCFPFVIEHKNERVTRFFLPGIEVDNGTESIRSYDYTRSHFRTKLAQYLTILREQTYQLHLGFPDLHIPIVTTSLARIETMKELLRGMTAEFPHYRKKFLFKVFREEATGWALNEPWDRADNPRLYLDRP